MNRERKIRPGVAAPERIKTETEPSKDSVPTQNSTTDASNGQFRIADFLSTGRENALRIRDLETITKLDSRTIRSMIQQERLGGVRIISDNHHGYWIAKDPAEVRLFSRSMRHRAKEIMRTVAAIEQAKLDFD